MYGCESWTIKKAEHHWDDPEEWDGEGGGWGIRMGNTCTPMADSWQCMAKPLQYYKVIILQLK